MIQAIASSHALLDSLMIYLRASLASSQWWIFRVLPKGYFTVPLFVNIKMFQSRLDLIYHTSPINLYCQVTYSSPHILMIFTPRQSHPVCLSEHIHSLKQHRPVWRRDIWQDCCPGCCPSEMSTWDLDHLSTAKSLQLLPLCSNPGVWSLTPSPHVCLQILAFPLNLTSDFHVWKSL